MHTRMYDEVPGLVEAHAGAEGGYGQHVSGSQRRSNEKQEVRCLIKGTHPVAQHGGEHAGVVPVAQLAGLHHGAHQVCAGGQLRDRVERLPQDVLLQGGSACNP